MPCFFIVKSIIFLTFYVILWLCDFPFTIIKVFLEIIIFTLCYILHVNLKKFTKLDSLKRNSNLYGTMKVFAYFCVTLFS
ncbi:hypothetical protein C1646_708839 [Rhizophagus diaphanus]|nr:hypothetical protein C1646_708839 [Rhizophagus diaphanus] [Rhizophagus sp. MUCL 43196]